MNLNIRLSNMFVSALACVAIIFLFATNVFAQNIKINCGGFAESPFNKDQYHSGGTLGTLPTIDTSGATNPAPSNVYLTHRYAPTGTSFSYTIPVTANRTHRVRLHFNSESSAGNSNTVTLNGASFLTNFDAFVASGNQNYKAVIREQNVAVGANGSLVIIVSAGATSGYAVLSGLEVIEQSGSSTNWSTETLLESQNGYVGIAGSGNVVHALYGEYNGCTIGSPVRYRRSTDEGTSFAPAVTLATDARLYLEDTIVADGNVVAATYYKNFAAPPNCDSSGGRELGNLYIRVSRDGGVNWGTEFQLSSAQRAIRHSVVISGTNIHVVWMNIGIGSNIPDVMYRRSLNSGATWEDATVLVAGTNATGAERPQIAANGNILHVVWMDGRDNNNSCLIEGGTMLTPCTEIYYKKSTTNGTTWGTDVRLTNSSAESSEESSVIYSGRPDVTTDGSNTVYVLYDKRTPATSDNEIALRKSTNNGTTFGAQVFLTNAPGVSTHSSGIVVGTTLYTIWIDNKNGGINKVYARDGDGVIFGTEQIVSSSGIANAPLVGASSSYIHAIWSNGTTIMYSRRLIN